VGRGSIAVVCLLPIAAGASLMVVAVMSGFVVLWGLSLRGEVGFFPFALLPFYLLRQLRSGPIFLRETPPLCMVAGQLVELDADFPKSQLFTFGQRVGIYLSLDCFLQVVHASISTGYQRHGYLSELNLKLETTSGPLAPYPAAGLDNPTAIIIRRRRARRAGPDAGGLIKSQQKQAMACPMRAPASNSCSFIG